jgi:hypothetical protein
MCIKFKAKRAVIFGEKGRRAAVNSGRAGITVKGGGLGHPSKTA